MLKEKEKMPYDERLKRYNDEKRQLWSSGLTPNEYCKEIKKLSEKWEV